jgi:hypothetical protein
VSTRAEQIIEALKNLLTAAPQIAGGNIWRSRLRPIPAGKALAIVVKRGNESRLERTTIGNYMRQLSVNVEIYARGDVPDQLADGLIEECLSRVMADREFGGLADDTELGGIGAEWDQKDTDLVVMDMEFLVTYEVAETSLA